MKPFITDACKDGRCTLRFQLEGVERDRLKDILIGSCVVAYALPAGHSFECAWQFRLLLKDGGILEFSSASTVVSGWQEVGSLNIKFIQDGEDSDGDVFNKFLVKKFCVDAVESLVYEDSTVYSECGIVLCDASGDEFIVAAGVSPGSVSIKAPFPGGKFSPEFSLDDYFRADI